MSEIITNNSKHLRKGVRKSQKLSPRVDLTPMVDLGFLLITFFIFTTAMAEPVAIKMNMPDDNGIVDSTEVSEERILTLLPAKNNQLFYYEGRFVGHLIETNYTDIRAVIVEKKRQLLNTFGSSKLSVLIKATDEATYKNVVNCLDEMVICDVSTYMLLDLNSEEITVLRNY